MGIGNEEVDNTFKSEQEIAIIISTKVFLNSL